jgi:hypothetical protein
VNRHHDWVRWMLGGMTFALGIGFQYVGKLLQISEFTRWICPLDPKKEAALYVGILLLLDAYWTLLSLVCMAAWLGLKRAPRWAVWTGRVASIGLLFGFPWLTPFGRMRSGSLPSQPKRPNSDRATSGVSARFGFFAAHSLFMDGGGSRATPMLLAFPGTR